MDDDETLNRRARLRELIQVAFDDQLIKLMNHIEARTGKKPNQGELSALQKDNSPSKSFGDKKAKTLTEQIGLNRRWFDMPLGTNLSSSQWLNEGREIGKTQNIEPEIESLLNTITEAAKSGSLTAEQAAAFDALIKTTTGNK